MPADPTQYRRRNFFLGREQFVNLSGEGSQICEHIPASANVKETTTQNISKTPKAGDFALG